jgi:hypothetical protein
MLLHSWYISSAHAYFELSVGTQYSLWIPTAEAQWGDVRWLGWLYNRPLSPTDQGISDLKKCKGFCGDVGVPSCWNVYPGGLVIKKVLNYICAGTWTRSVSLWRKQEPVTWFFLLACMTHLFSICPMYFVTELGGSYTHIYDRCTCWFHYTGRQLPCQNVAALYCFCHLTSFRFSFFVTKLVCRLLCMLGLKAWMSVFVFWWFCSCEIWHCMNG